jgi:hypothetical protein
MDRLKLQYIILLEKNIPNFTILLFLGLNMASGSKSNLKYLRVLSRM